MIQPTDNPQLLREYQADFDWCEQIIQRESKSFYAAFSGLPPLQRSAVYALYAFCRQADDCVDTHHSKEQLDAMGRQLNSFFAGKIPNQPLWRALGAVFGLFQLPHQPFYDMLEGQQRDLFFRQPQTLQELEEYSYYVAGSVGLMLLPLLARHPRELEEPAIALGTAMQLTNILRDIGEDFDAGRIYLPAALMKQYGYSKKDLAAKRVNLAFCTMWEALATRAEHLYSQFEAQAHKLDGDSRLPTMLALMLYRGILDAVRQNSYQCLTQRCYVSDEEKQRLVQQATLQYKNLPHTAAQAGEVWA